MGRGAKDDRRKDERQRMRDKDKYKLAKDGRTVIVWRGGKWRKVSRCRAAKDGRRTLIFWRRLDEVRQELKQAR